ncbi:glutaminase [Parvularcula marina]|uniref:glutaminase n=1 Tax=Parvularcula marina TaxID=2292771 RepID=UPI003516C603
MRIDHYDDFDWQGLLDSIGADIAPLLTHGEVANYIPALAAVDPESFAMAFVNLRGETFTTGRASTPFSIQSISKVFALILALELEGEALWDRVGREPSGTAFNSIVQLEEDHGVPRNPLINAGAIVVTDSIVGHCGESTAIARLLAFIRKAANSLGPRIDMKVAESEEAYGDRNRALAYFMKSFGILKEDVPIVLKAYFQQCAIAMSTVDLARAGLFLANGGTDPATGLELTTKTRTDRLNAIMMMCGHYDMSGDFAFSVGLPGKSGVGGGILAIIPQVGSVAVWSPRLNQAGNSLAGTQALQWFSERSQVTLF